MLNKLPANSILTLLLVPNKYLMNPAFARLLKQKKKRARDPNAPPPPTLLGQVKELRLTREEVDRLELQITIMHQRIDTLESRNRRLENTIEALQNWIRNRTR